MKLFVGSTLFGACLSDLISRIEEPCNAKIDSCKFTCISNDLLCMKKCDKLCENFDSYESSFKAFSIGTGDNGAGTDRNFSYIMEMPTGQFSPLSIAEGKYLGEIGFVFIDDEFYLLGGYQNYRAIATIKHGEYIQLPERLPMGFWTYPGAITKVNNKALMCFSDDGHSCMTFDGQSARIIEARSQHDQKFASMCEKNGQVYASGSDQNNEKIEFFIDNRWHYNSIYDNPSIQNGQGAVCVTVPEGVLFLDRSRTNLFNTENLTWVYAGNPYVAKATVRFVNNQLWAFQGSNNNYNVQLFWNGETVAEGPKKMLPIHYDISKPVILDEAEFALIS